MKVRDALSVQLGGDALNTNTDHKDNERGNGKGVVAMANKRIATNTRGELTADASSQAGGVLPLMIAPPEQGAYVVGFTDSASLPNQVQRSSPSLHLL